MGVPGPQLRSPLARAVVPVVAGALLIAAIFGATWLIADRASDGGDDAIDRLAPSTFEIGPVEAVAASVAENGPILFPGLETRSGERTLVVNHDGDDPAQGWEVFWAYPAGRSDCPVEQRRRTATFVDCDGAVLDVDELEPAAGVLPIVRDRRDLSIDLRAVSTGSTPGTVSTGATTGPVSTSG